MRVALVGPAADDGSRAVEARRGLPVRAGRDRQLSATERAGLHHPQPRGQERRLRTGARREVHHRVLST